ncbi:methylated-DNA--[protein]-cysteine S-methyltransferase [Arthrobacter sp. 35W]|uniref:methylated-DNA--[protein]-cysteine S-methyltransferase n=1 Tax=Arthrobacter sp. 35W TaxID=1132441 RepID=UPI000424EF94|nr:methylated-DNA--[protein]-cysteine S-methyltransferase [Arthrobacter sp. 35W]
MRTHALIDSPLGVLTAVADDGALCGVYMESHKRLPGPETMGALVQAATDPLFAATAQQLGEYFAHDRRAFDLPLAPVGNAFQHKVWEQLRLIPYGELRSYGDIARILGDRSLAQAVGSANGRNPISIIVPCHRVVGADGSLVGYAGGLARKEFLLELENPARGHAEALF